MHQWFVLLLPLCLCFDSEVTLVKTIGREPDETPICTNESVILLIVCRIRTELMGGECRLLYRDGHDFKHECDSRFTLKSVNQTVFLHLTNLTPVDSGNHTCECSREDGTYILQLNITVEDDLKDEDSLLNIPVEESYEAWLSHTSFAILHIIVIIIPALILVTGVVLGCILSRKCCRDDAKSRATGLSVSENPHFLDQDDPDDPYTSLQLPEASDLYETISSLHRQHDSKTNSYDDVATSHLDNEEIDGGEAYPSCKMYENA